MPTKQAQLIAARARVAELEGEIKRDSLAAAALGRPPMPEGWRWVEDCSVGPRARVDAFTLEMTTLGNVLLNDDDKGYTILNTAAICAFVDYLRQIGKAPPAHCPKGDAFALPLRSYTVAPQVKGWQPS